MESLSGMRESVWFFSDEGSVENYLFEAQGDSQPIFHGVQEEMSQLNDFCVLCIKETSKHLVDLRRRAKRFRDGMDHIEHPDFGNVSTEVAWSIEEFEIPTWDETEKFLVKAMCLILLSAFTEKVLKELSMYLAPPEATRLKRRPREGEIAGLLRYLRESCGLEFEEPESSWEVRSKCRVIRNDFAHGRWSAVKNAISDVRLSEAFKAVTALFREIDTASVIQE